MKKFIVSILVFGFSLSIGLSVSASTLHVTHTSSLSWRASFDIKVKKNKIIKVSHIKVISYTGKIINKKLIRNSSNKVTLKITKRLGSTNYTTKLIAKLKNKKLFVSTN